MLRLKPAQGLVALYLERCDVSACVTGFAVVDRQPCPFVALSRDVVLLFPSKTPALVATNEEECCKLYKAVLSLL